MIFTDGFSYSATSILLKNIQLFGGAIIVGFNGYPKEGKETFDSSQSPTNVNDNINAIINVFKIID